MIELSYIIATRNRLPFLKIILSRLLDALQPDEEVVIVDGNSNDGTGEYLQQLFYHGVIHQYISEPDKNQAHGWNKAMLMAKGTIIKKIIDDDVFCYNAIRRCKEYMLHHPDVDVVISNDLESKLASHQHIEIHSRLSQYEDWSRGLTSNFTFGDVHMLIRRSSLAFIGLYNTEYVMMDWEYSLRISNLQSNIVYYTGYNALSVTHPQTISSQKNQQLIKEQGRRGSAFYNYPGDEAQISTWSKIKIAAGTALYNNKRTDDINAFGVPLNEAYDHFYQYINRLNEDASFRFISKNNNC